MALPNETFTYQDESGAYQNIEGLRAVRFDISYFNDNNSRENIRVRGTALLNPDAQVRVGTGIQLNQDPNREQAFADAVHFLTEGLVNGVP
ncbi:MAG: hypothetical protein FJX76_01645 [Armatimonadetes bacterium]|nr:hypothetical protein [Armatimonadota bacterium]